MEVRGPSESKRGLRFMKAIVFSDLHLAHCDLDYPLDFPSEAEIAIIAGDILAPVSSSLKWIYEHVVMRGLQVIFVAGNHEHYGHILHHSLEDGMGARKQCPGLNWLENEVFIFDGVRFLGASMWTDYDLHKRPDESMHVALLSMNDHRLIHTLDREGRRGRFYPQDALAIHQQSRAWLEGELAKTFEGPTVVVTHHCPHPNSIHPRYAGDKLNPAFTSDLSALIERYQPAAWVHGHTHSSFDYWVGKTRIVCNPRGYVRRTFGGREIENEQFEPFKMIDV